MQRATHGETKILGLHWMACCLLSEAQRATVFGLWTARGLVESVAQAENAVAMVTAGLNGEDKTFLEKFLGIASQAKLKCEPHLHSSAEPIFNRVERH